MSHTVHVNNYVEIKEKSPIDILSKIYIVLQWILGINRMGVMSQNKFLNIIYFIYPLFVTGVLFYAFARSEVSEVYHQGFKLFQFLIVGLLCLLTRERLLKYYSELKKFDTAVSCRIKVTREALLLFFTMTTINFVTFGLWVTYDDYFYLVSLHLIQTIENYYYGYLFLLLKQRLQLMNYVLESSLLSYSGSKVPAKMESDFVALKANEKKIEISMNNLMDLYYLIILAFDLLSDAVKWQLLFIIITSFIYTLALCHDLALIMLSSHTVIDLTGRVIHLCVTIVSETLPLMGPCVGCDMVRQKVRKLRELLASKLFETEMDKSERSVARALLTLTKSRDLSFSLLHMVDVSVSLPFSFLGLLATYLIIMLQFEKVIDPSRLGVAAVLNSTAFPILN